ncbi:hypothetical protein RUND412_002007 [Rhizina undulata]
MAVDEVNGDLSLKSSLSEFSASTLAIHADDHLASTTDVAPPIHVSTTFKYSNDPEELQPVDGILVPAASKDAPASHIYSRLTAQSTTRLEYALGHLLNGHVTSYSTGLSAFHALLVRVNPKRLAIGDCYHGCHGVANIFSRLTGMKQIPLDCAAEELEEGDLIHLETPLNPTGEAHSIVAYAEKAHSRGAILSVDATFAPPPLQDPFLHGADWVLHSATKYIGGHSDLLAGVLVTKSTSEANHLKAERTFLGSVMGGLEGWLGLRSIRTMSLRVERQSSNATNLARWLSAAIKFDPVVAKVVDKVSHASLQPEEPWLKEQMPNGFGPVFAIYVKNEKQARYLPSKLQLFHHATSLGGVESLIEWRAMSDATCDRRLLRVSVGVEGWEDLKNDLRKGIEEVAEL